MKKKTETEKLNKETTKTKQNRVNIQYNKTKNTTHEIANQVNINQVK